MVRKESVSGHLEVKQWFKGVRKDPVTYTAQTIEMAPMHKQSAVNNAENKDCVKGIVRHFEKYAYLSV